MATDLLLCRLISLIPPFLVLSKVCNAARRDT
jgi:hypothetical protein